MLQALWRDDVELRGRQCHNIWHRVDRRDDKVAPRRVVPLHIGADDRPPGLEGDAVRAIVRDVSDARGGGAAPHRNIRVEVSRSIV